VRTAVRDGFVDRYTGTRLVFPGTLRLLSILSPEELPFHPNWAYDRCHPMYWELYPTLDHVHPIALGGADAEESWVTTSQRMNSAKAHWTLADLGWQLQTPGSTRHPEASIATPGRASARDRAHAPRRARCSDTRSVSKPQKPKSPHDALFRAVFTTPAHMAEELAVVCSSEPATRATSWPNSRRSPPFSGASTPRPGPTSSRARS
jgi:hypothetical protein